MGLQCGLKSSLRNRHIIFLGSANRQHENGEAGTVRGDHGWNQAIPVTTRMVGETAMFCQPWEITRATREQGQIDQQLGSSIDGDQLDGDRRTLRQ
jgi:hypothetical protein